MSDATDIKSSFVILFLNKVEGGPTYNGIHEANFNLLKLQGPSTVT